MLPFSTLFIRRYYEAIGWNEDNSYSQLTRASTALLDFAIPESLVLQLANAPTPIFFTSYRLDALPQLNGSISYITTSDPLQHIRPSQTIPFKTVVERFQVWPLPHRPLPKDEVWQGGRRVEGRDYLLYSRVHLPTLHLSGLATTRLTPTLQAHLAFLAQPSPPTIRPNSPTSAGHSRQPSETGSSGGSAASPQVPGNVLLSIQHDTGRWAGEYTYSAEDGMFGLRGLWNFGWSDPDGVGRRLTGPLGVSGGVENVQDVAGKRIDEDEMMEGGLKGRFSAGGEVYFSAKQRSFGISTGLRFTTVPPTLPLPPNAPAPSPPTVLTLLYNPLIGFISSAYSAQVSPTVALSTRFGVNVYSYESDLCIGGEWWIGRGRGKRNTSPDVSVVPDGREDERVIPKELWLRNESSTIIEPTASQTTSVIDRHTDRETTPIPGPGEVTEVDRDGVLKARISGNLSVAMLYEARIRNCLVSFGVVSDLLSRQRPIRSVGVEVQYYS